MTLHIGLELLDRLEDHARREWPREACGLLLGRLVGEDAAVEDVIEAVNIANDPRRAFMVDWHSLEQALRGGQSGVHELIGVYHSHPDGSTGPSRIDRRAAWSEHRHIILAMWDGVVSALQAWRASASDRDFVEEPLIVSSDLFPAPRRERIDANTLA